LIKFLLLAVVLIHLTHFIIIIRRLLQEGHCWLLIVLGLYLLCWDYALGTGQLGPRYSIVVIVWQLEFGYLQLIGCRYHGDAGVELLLTVIILQFNFEFAVHVLRARVLAAQLNLLMAPIQA